MPYTFYDIKSKVSACDPKKKFTLDEASRLQSYMFPTACRNRQQGQKVTLQISKRFGLNEHKAIFVKVFDDVNETT